ncbi:unnamed protein product [Fraxinus pennsylvanica]|uniref:DUS-like FMN-binding domain-containing protein n=1 Tax=Fraxinus pennsylvanica TaxID=56036 RepID=A0AAD2AFW7_9LAMI|nr:unnamed protein product [Fraxinus pennsylvanica]
MSLFDAEGQASEWALLRRHSSEDLFGVQICGAYPDTVSRTVELIEKHCMVDFVDINMKGAGSALLTKPMRMKSVIEASSRAVDTPVTIKIVHATLDNYERDIQNEEDDERGKAHHNWVDDVVRWEGRGTPSVGGEFSPSHMNIRPRPGKKDPSLLTREEVEAPKIWAEICIQRMVELGKESTTMRRIFDPMFVYFDAGRHWVPQHGLATIVLSDMSYFMENSVVRSILGRSPSRPLCLQCMPGSINGICVQQKTWFGGKIIEGGYGILSSHLGKNSSACMSMSSGFVNAERDYSFKRGGQNEI